MNPFFKPTSEETEVIEYINKFNLNEFALIRITPTMYEKSIIDASGNIRKILFEKGLIDFKEISKGGEKEYKQTIILTNEVIETKASFYRPKTKEGDPRFWIYNLKTFTEINELLYLTISDNTLIAIPLKSINKIENIILQIFKDPENEEIILDLRKKLKVLKEIGPITSVDPNTSSPKDVGLTLERFLNVKVNSLKTPDYLGKIELKSKRQGKSKDSLFSKVPDVDISKYQKTKKIIEKFGVLDSQNRIALYNNITTKPNSHGLYLLPNNDKLILFQNYFLNGKEDDVCAWHYSTLQNALDTKHPTTLWVSAIEEKNDKGIITFRYVDFELTTKPVFSEFISLIERDLINFDWKGHVTNGKKRDHGPGFRIDKINRKLLFKSLINIT